MSALRLTFASWEPSWTPLPLTVVLGGRRSGDNSSKHSNPLPKSPGAARCPLLLPHLPVARVLLQDGEERPPTPAGSVGTVETVCSAKTIKPPYSSLSILVLVLVHLIVRSETALVA